MHCFPFEYVANCYLCYNSTFFLRLSAATLEEESTGLRYSWIIGQRLFQCGVFATYLYIDVYKSPKQNSF